MASSSSSRVPRIGSMTPRQFGEIAKPSRLDLIRLDMEKQGVVPDDNIYAQLPGSLTKGREWNLPETQEHLLHTAAYPYPYPGKRRDIIGTNHAYWQVQDPSPLAGEKIGTQTFMKLMFKKKGEPETTGNWRAIEYKSLANDGRAAGFVWLGQLDIWSRH